MVAPTNKRLNQFGLRDLTGLQLGSFKVLFKTASKIHSWRVECVCGTRMTVKHRDLMHTNRPKTHCGCQNRGLPTLHKLEYSVWNMMIRRCEDPNHVGYKYYGGRGIKVCPQWHEFKVFLEDVGPRPSKRHTLDRLNSDGNYEPGNVRWATVEEQARNKRASLYLPHPETGKMVPAAEVAEVLGMSYQQMRNKYIMEGKWPGQQ